MEHKRKIRFNPTDVHEFVTSAEKCDFDIDVFFTIDSPWTPNRF